MSEQPITNVADAVRELGALPVPVGSVPQPDAITRVFVPVQALREPEGEFYSFLHHENRTPHDLPELGGQR